ncbi:cytidylyltransferase domain-containing protein [Epilithonimonas sp.]|uniref:cytidylyltransferase domain-containing protein n=1 Tax=Epilithonimonas sp. TaxID=2894511 RepID=UPI0028AECB8E|nr:HAD hydrolase-like protein [Epilithonimonas sp.]
MNKTLAFIPVRGGSKSIPQKNIKNFCGKPLVYWNIKALEETSQIDQIIIATDSEDIINVVESFKFSKTKIYKRSSENAQDTSSTESVMLEYLEQIDYQQDDTFILVQATSPLTRTQDFSSALKTFNNSDCDSLLTGVRFKRFFWNEDGTSKNYDYQNRPRRQDFQGEFMENGAFYINKIGNILKDKNRLSGKIALFEMPEFTSFEIDEPDDWVIAEQLMKRHILKNDKSVPKIKLFLTDVDGVLTDAGMYYAENGDELKKFNTHDGMGFDILRQNNIKTGIVTSEITQIVERRAKKLKVDFLYQGKREGGKLEAAKEICEKLDVTLQETAYIGDDINCFNLLSEVGLAACPQDALPKIKSIPGIQVMALKGGEGCVREFIEKILN